MSTTPPHRRPRPSEALTSESIPTGTELAEVLELTPKPSRAEVAWAALRRGPEVLNKPPVEWLIPGHIPARSWGILYGPPGSGKSFFSLSLALAMAAGDRWQGLNLEPAQVLYVIAERADVVTEREEAWSLHRQEPIPGRFADLAWAPQIATDQDLGILLNIVQELRPRLVVLDTFARCILGQDENSALDMGPVVENLSALAEATDRGSVLVVHHTGKDVSRGLRGSTALLGGADYTYEVAGDSTAIRVTPQKLNAGPRNSATWWKLDGLLLPALPGQDEMRSGAVLVPTTGRDAGGSRLPDLLRLMAASYTESGVTRRDVEEMLEVKRTAAGEVLAAGKAGGYLTSSGKPGAALRYFLTELGLESI